MTTTNKFVIYKITNKINNKKYIGYTGIGLNNRIHKHYTNAQSGMVSHLYNALRKYGMNNFKFETIDNSDSFDEIKEKEKYWIKYYNTNKNGYNMTNGGDGGNIIGTLSPQKYKDYIIKLKKRTNAENNPRHSGYTDEEIVNYAVNCFIENDFNWIKSEWLILCNKYNIPKSFSKCRFENKGYKGLKKQMLNKLNAMGYNLTIEDLKYKPTKEHKNKVSNYNKEKHKKQNKENDNILDIHNIINNVYEIYVLNNIWDYENVLEKLKNKYNVSKRQIRNKISKLGLKKIKTLLIKKLNKNGYSIKRLNTKRKKKKEKTKEEKNSIRKNFIKKTSLRMNGKNNPQYSGYTDEEIINYAIKCFIENNYNWSYKYWINNYCKKYNLPQTYGKFRFDGLGYKGFKQQLIIELNKQLNIVAYFEKNNKIKIKNTSKKC